ncbi:MAG: cyclic nucleotide-binding domain-containing protein [Ignavibacteriales bacterium]|nr:cyclic nucleotide-binding domain-containing protein [Ignavibacteriales bacterium]
MKEIPEGDIIYQNGDPSESVYLILYGLVKIKIKTKTGAKIITKAVGDFFGEREVMENHERTSTAIAEMGTQLYLIEKSRFLDLTYNDKEIKINVKINLAKTYDLSKEGAEAILTKNDPSYKSGQMLSPGVTPLPEVKMDEPKAEEPSSSDEVKEIDDYGFVAINKDDEAEQELPDEEPDEEDEDFEEEIFDDEVEEEEDEFEEEIPEEEIEDEGEDFENEIPEEEIEEDEEEFEEEFPDEETEEDEEDFEEEFPDKDVEDDEAEFEEEFPDEETEEEEEDLEEDSPNEEINEDELEQELPDEEDEDEEESELDTIPEYKFDDKFEDPDPEFELEETKFDDPWTDDDDRGDLSSEEERQLFASDSDEISDRAEFEDEDEFPGEEFKSGTEIEEKQGLEDIDLDTLPVVEEIEREVDDKETVSNVNEAQFEKNLVEIEALRKNIKLISGLCKANSPLEIYETLKEDLPGIIDAREFMMFVFDGGFLASVADHHDEGTNFAIREKIAYELITMQEPVTLFDLDSSGIMEGLDQVDETQIPSSLLYYPLIESEKRVIGCFLFFTSINGRFSHSDVIAIEDFAKSTSGILEKITTGQTPVAYKYDDLEKYTAFFGAEIKMAVETILSVSETLDRGKLAEKVRYGFDIIRERASGLKGFLDSIQYFLGKLSGFSKQPYLVSELLDDFLVKVSESAKQREVTLLRKYDSDIVMFFNRELFIHALSLITQNSFDAMPNGGKIYFSTSANESNILISIRDTGSGIHPDLREKIFEPFFSIGKTGVGLGLPIANKIIKEHGGYIYLESSRTQGTEIIIALPV